MCGNPENQGPYEMRDCYYGLEWRMFPSPGVRHGSLLISVLAFPFQRDFYSVWYM